VAISVDAYRARLEAMNADSGEEWYRHFAGLKPTLELAAVDEEFEELFTLEACQELADAEAPAELRRAAVEGHLTAATRPITDRIATREATLEVTVERRTIPYREVAPVLVNEPDTLRRRALYDARTAVVEDAINPMLDEALAVEREHVADLGSPTLRALYEGFGWDLDGLLAMTEDVIAQTERLHERELDRALRSRVGLPLDAAGPQDVSRLWRAPEFDTAFAADRALPALRGTLEGMGIHLDRQPNIELDIESRPGKIPRAFCAPILVPDRVMLVILPQGGHDDWLALFHEAGHAQHFGHMSRMLPAEDRVRGDNGVTEGWAFLFDHLVTTPAWLGWRVEAPPQDYARFNALYDLHMLRRYCGKLAYELELHGGASPDVLGERYVHHLGRATLVPPPPANRLVDVDPLLYCTSYLRAWAFAAQVSRYLEERWGREWFRRRAAGLLLRELWELGQSLDADRLLHELTGETLSFEPLLERTRERLA
jgi:hypothetical protein